MKKFLLTLSALVIGTVAASAADLSKPYTKAPPAPPPPPPFSWTGFYIGANIGGAWAHNDWTDTIFLTNFNNASNGVFIGGGQIGGNYQIGQFVIGGEWDFDWAGNNNNNTGVFIPALGNTIVVTNNDRWITTLAARFGWAFDHFLLYGKLGGGWVGHNNLTVTDVTTGVSITCGSFSTLTNCGNNTGGWLAGIGGEYAFTNNWTVKFEYDYLGLGNRTFFIPVTSPIVTLAGDTFTTNNRNVQMFKVGVNYLFNWGAPGYGRY